MEGQVAGLADGPEPARDGWEVLFSPARLAVLRQVGLTAAADPGMERFARLVASMLFGLKPTDPSTYAIAALLLGAVAFLATFLPARRAARTDPMVALRSE